MHIDDRLSIPDDELVFTASRSGGPGGQHVNKVSSRVTLRFDVERSPSLSASQKMRIRSTLATRISKEGILRVVCRAHRSQSANRRAAVERFAKLLQEALRRRKSRRKTAAPPEARRRRLEDKRRRGRLKRERSKNDD